MEQKFPEIIGRVEHVRKHLKLNKSGFAGNMGIKPQTYNNFVGFQKSKPNIELLHGLYSVYQVNPVWLLNGKGSMFVHGGYSGNKPDSGYSTPDLPAMALHEPSVEAGVDERWEAQARGQRLSMNLSQMEMQMRRMEKDNLAPIDYLIAYVKRFYQLHPTDVAKEMQDLLTRLTERYSNLP